jgi:hypothetical protein
MQRSVVQFVKLVQVPLHLFLQNLVFVLPSTVPVHPVTLVCTATDYQFDPLLRSTYVCLVFQQHPVFLPQFKSLHQLCACNASDGTSTM